MCTNYRPSSRDLIRETLGVAVDFDYPQETWKGYVAPIVRLQDGQRIAQSATFGLIPPWCKSPQEAKKLTSGTMNARSETVSEKPSFRNAWRKSNFCLVPMQEFYEPSYVSGKAERWSVGLASGAEFCVAGIWSWWINPETREGSASFSLLTLNCDAHQVLNQLHKPDDEKRSLYIVPPAAYDQWLAAVPAQAGTMLTLSAPETYRISAAPKQAKAVVAVPDLFS